MTDHVTPPEGFRLHRSGYPRSMVDVGYRGQDWGTPVGLVVPSAPRSVSRVRRFAVDACVEHGWSRWADTVALLVSEVVTNAVLHAHGPRISVRMLDRRGCLRVEVDDDSAERPTPRGGSGDAGAEHGRGLVLVEGLASRWGVEARRGGKTSWFEIRP